MKMKPKKIPKKPASMMAKKKMIVGGYKSKNRSGK